MSVGEFWAHLRRRMHMPRASVWCTQDISRRLHGGHADHAGRPTSTPVGRPGRERDHLRQRRRPAGSGHSRRDPHHHQRSHERLARRRSATGTAASRSPTCSPASTPCGRDAELPHARAQERRAERGRAAVGRHARRSTSAASAKPSSSKRAARRSTSPRRSTAASSPRSRSNRSRSSAAT